jgi:hypothetical protein
MVFASKQRTANALIDRVALISNGINLSRSEIVQVENAMTGYHGSRRSFGRYSIRDI